ncbi:GNAT family N-acetyltransferase [Streptomyces sp. HNM0663]|uniref:GNAT family N-acetyltransferase n=1 Tax=Streptomyces chengmaiensis TaxID=3040919 RepID=A0ABT6HZB6_9ACTN|nr:GNAT family N-acetyltransferase [Streptomyces chengmaiensis]MDH2393139.1 GNAT family N-acetyltransferase [Streptomyces chengmaiensis]
MVDAERSAIIRPRRESDIPRAALALVQTHHRDGYPVEGVNAPEQWLTSPPALNAWVADLNGEIVGHVAINHPTEGDAAVSLWKHSGEDDKAQAAVLARLFVAPQARGIGLGKLLVDAATEYAETKRLRLVLDVMTKDKAAIRLYERLGWSRLGEVVHTFGEGQQTPAVCYVSPPN